jgi:hypothetical protein
MFAAPLLVALLMLATLQHVQLPDPEVLLRVPVSDEITTLWVATTPGLTQVTFLGQSFRMNEERPKPLSEMTFQVWVLRANGTVLRPNGPPGSAGPICNAGSCNDNMTLGFEPVTAKELAGVAVSVDGKLFVHAIKPS